MDASIALKTLSSQTGTHSKGGLKSKTYDSPATAFGVILKGTVSKGTKPLLNQSTTQVPSIDLQALKQQLNQVIGALNEEKQPVSADSTQLKGMIEQILKNLNGQNGEDSSTQKKLVPLLKDLGEALGKKQVETEGDPKDAPWGQLLAAFNTIIHQGQPLLQKDSGQGDFSEGGKLKSTAQPKTYQVTSTQEVLATPGMKASDLSNKQLQPVLSTNKEPIQKLAMVAPQAGQVTPSEGSEKTSKATKVTSLIQLQPEKQKAVDSNGKSGVDVSALITVGRPMNKVQQLLFHQSSAPQQSPADQIANQIKAWVSQGALKSTDGQLSISLNLHPDNLGAVQIAINQTDGGLTASITAHSGLTKDLIESQLDHLQQTLSASGIAVNKLDVSLAQTPSGTSDPTYQPPQDQGQGRNNPSHHQSKPQEQAKEGPEFEKWLEEGLDV